MKNIYEITLPSFIRRTLKAPIIKAEIKNTGCKLNRKGRSRNWVLAGNFEQLQKVSIFIENANEDSWLWIATKISQHKKTLSFSELSEIAQKDPNITIVKLMEKTDCTIAEARHVLDQLEGF